MHPESMCLPDATALELDGDTRGGGSSEVAKRERRPILVK